MGQFFKHLKTVSFSPNYKIVAMLRHSVRSALCGLVEEKMLKPTDPVYIHVGWELSIISHEAEKEKKKSF